MATQPATVEQYAARNLRDRIERMAAEMNEYAARLHQHAAAVGLVGQPGCARYADVANGVQNDLMNMLPNLNLGGLTRLAAEADIARAKGE